MLLSLNLIRFIGCDPSDVLSIGVHYAFIDWLWLTDPNDEKRSLNNFYNFNRKPSSKKTPDKKDKLSSVVALAEFRELLLEFSITSYIADSANDNYTSYDLCSVWNNKPFIDLNSKNEGNFHLSIDDNGVTICIGDHKMIFNWFDKTHSRIKWLVPMRIRIKTVILFLLFLLYKVLTIDSFTHW